MPTRAGYSAFCLAALALVLWPGVLCASPVRAETVQARSPPRWEVPAKPLEASRWPSLWGIEHALIPLDRPWRQLDRSMTPRYVTVHGTGNTQAGTDARAHAQLLIRGQRSRDAQSRTGYVTWHFTVDDHQTIQHLPAREQGDHADFSGPGNRESLGVEIAMPDGQDHALSLHRSAMLVALLMRQYQLGLARVVPHHHWPRFPDQSHKACPVMLLDDGKPGRHWKQFLALVAAYHAGLGRLRDIPQAL